MVPTLLQQVRWGAMVTEPEARPDPGKPRATGLDTPFDDPEQCS